MAFQDRLNQLFGLLESNRFATDQELALLMGVSIRQIKRYVHRLKQEQRISVNTLRYKISDAVWGNKRTITVLPPSFHKPINRGQE